MQFSLEIFSFNVVYFLEAFSSNCLYDCTKTLFHGKSNYVFSFHAPVDI